MKKLFIITSVLLLFLLAVPIFLPDNLVFKKSVLIKAPESFYTTYLSPKKGWKNWWPDQKGIHISGDTLYASYKGARFHFSQGNSSTIPVVSEFGEETSTGTITLAPVDLNTLKVTWVSQVKTGYNPFRKLNTYLKARVLDNRMKEVLDHMRSYMEDERNLYGISVRRSKVKDTLILTTKRVFKRKPSDSDIYNLIRELRAYSREKEISPTGNPIANISQIASNDYQLMVGLPVNKEIGTNGSFYIRKMLKNGNLLETEVRGGRNTISNAVSQMKAYLQDQGLSSPAIPFEGIVTDRMAEKDTSKWITRIYYPIY